MRVWASILLMFVLLPAQGAADKVTATARAASYQYPKHKVTPYEMKVYAAFLEQTYVPQANGREYPFTVFEFALMARYPYLSPFSAPSDEDEEAVREALGLTGMEDFSERFLSTLSGGERQKVFIAAALSQKTGILLLDEPATFLDPRHQAEIFEGFTFGLDASVPDLVDSISEAMRRIVEAANEELGIASPSQVFYGIGRYLMEGLAKGIASMGPVADLPGLGQLTEMAGAGRLAGASQQVSHVYHLHVRNDGQRDSMRNYVRMLQTLQEVA